MVGSFDASFSGTRRFLWLGARGSARGGQYSQIPSQQFSRFLPGKVSRPVSERASGERARERASKQSNKCASRQHQATANLHTKMLDFRGFGSSRILILRGGILMSIWDFPESLSQQILVGIILVVRLGVVSPFCLFRNICNYIYIYMYM